MKIAIVGSGISGMLAARLLFDGNDIHVFESNDYVGGHTNTAAVEAFGKNYAADTGFMVFNERTYPNFVKMLRLLGTEARDSDMSFSVRCDRSGIEYNGSTLRQIFAQPRNALRPSFHRMLRDILRFNRQAPADVRNGAADATLGDYVLRARYADRDFQVGFQVMEYRKPEFTAEVETAKPTYLTGETVEATVRLRYTFGGSVSGARVLYEIYRMPYTFDAEALRSFSWFFADPARAEERRQAALAGMEAVKEGELRTDEKGEARLSFETEPAEQDRAYVVSVRAQDVNREWIADQKTVFVTQKGYFAVVRTDRKVYRPKEKVTAQITTVNALQMPVAAKGKIVVLRRLSTPRRDLDRLARPKVGAGGAGGAVRG